MLTSRTYGSLHQEGISTFDRFLRARMPLLRHESQAALQAWNLHSRPGHIGTTPVVENDI